MYFTFDHKKRISAPFHYTYYHTKEPTDFIIYISMLFHTNQNTTAMLPGRIKQLIDEGHLSVDSIRLFVLDEADKLMDGDFQETINWIYSSLPGNKQMLALSATYPEVLAQHLTAYMRNPTFIRLNATDPALLGK